MLAEGVYKGRVVSWGFGESSKGSRFFQIVTQLHSAVDIDGTETDLGEGGVKRSLQLYMTPKTIDRTCADVRYLGFDGDDMSRLDPSHPEAHDFSGKEVLVRVAHDEYNGRPKEQCNLQRESKKLNFADIDPDLKELFARHQQDARPAPTEEPAQKGKSADANGESPGNWVTGYSEDRPCPALHVPAEEADPAPEPVKKKKGR